MDRCGHAAAGELSRTSVAEQLGSSGSGCYQNCAWKGLCAVRFVQAYVSFKQKCNSSVLCLGVRRYAFCED